MGESNSKLFLIRRMAAKCFALKRTTKVSNEINDMELFQLHHDLFDVACSKGGVLL